MNKTTKKVFLSVFTLIIAIALAVSTTYAWFAISTEPEIRQFEVNVTAGENLLVAVTKVGEGAPLAQAEYKSYIGTNEIVGEAGEFFDFENNSFSISGKLTTATSSNALGFEKLEGNLLSGEGAYFAFDLHFIGSEPFIIRLHEESSVNSIMPEEDNLFPAYVWEDVAGFTFGNVTLGAEGSQIIAHAKNAVRIAFRDKIYEPNHDAEDAYGRYGLTTGTNLGLEYYNFMLGANFTAPVVNPVVFT